MAARPVFAVGSTTDPSATPPEISKRAVVLAVARRGGPHLLEATFVPAALFYCCLVWGGLTLAYVTVLGWMYGSVARRLVRRRRVPIILVLGVVGITVRTAMARASGSTFVYFVQPIVGTIATAGVFLLSLVGGRPLIGRLAVDFWPITPEMADNPRVISLFRGRTVLWAGINLATAAATLTLLLTLPLATFVAAKLVRYADDFLVLVAGTRTDAERVRDETARVFLPMGLRLSEEKTVIVHIDEGFDFLGMHIQRHKKLGAEKRYVYTYPSRAALASVKAKVRSATRGTTNQSLSELLNRLNPVLRGWTNYHRHGAASKTFSYLTAFTWRRVWIWLRHKHPKATVKELRRRYLPGWHPQQDEARLFYPETVAIVRYRYRGTAIPSPWATTQAVA